MVFDHAIIVLVTKKPLYLVYINQLRLSSSLELSMWSLWLLQWDLESPCCLNLGLTLRVVRFCLQSFTSRLATQNVMLVFGREVLAGIYQCWSVMFQPNISLGSNTRTRVVMFKSQIQHQHWSLVYTYINIPSKFYSNAPQIPLLHWTFKDGKQNRNRWDFFRETKGGYSTNQWMCS